VKTPGPGEWSDLYQDAAHRAAVEAVCPLCQVRGVYLADKSHVRPTRHILSLVCQVCNRRFYATPVQATKAR
jgi:hypothetical protein